MAWVKNVADEESKMFKKGVTSMVWVIGASIIVSFFALLPVIYDVLGLHGDYLKELWGYAPNQFLFLLIPFPLAAFCAFVGLRYVLVKIDADKIGDPILSWLINNWSVALLIGAILVSVVTIADYFYTAKVFDRLEPEYAAKAVMSAKVLRQKVEEHSDEAGREKERKQINDEAENMFNHLSENKPLSKNEILLLKPAVYLKLLLDAGIQRKWKLLNPTAHALSVLQLFTSLMVAFVAILSLLMIHLAVKVDLNVDLGRAVDAITYCILFFAVYPICYRYFVAEMQLVTGFSSSIRGDIMSSIMIIVAAGIVLTIDPNRRDLLHLFYRGLPFLLVIGPSVYAAITGPLSLRTIIGIDSNPGTRITLFIIMFLIAAFIILSIWPRVNTAGREPNKPVHPAAEKRGG